MPTPTKELSWTSIVASLGSSVAAEDALYLYAIQGVETPIDGVIPDWSNIYENYVTPGRIYVAHIRHQYRSSIGPMSPVPQEESAPIPELFTRRMR